MSDRSATYDQVEAAYYAMQSQAIEANDGITYWQGGLTNMLEENGISRAKYSQITGYLKRMGCIERIRRGAGNVDSIWILWKPPNREDFENSKLHSPESNTRYEDYKKKQQDLQYMKDKIKELEVRLDEAGI